MPSRKDMFAALKAATADKPLDVLVIGGGATGTGCAVDAASRYAPNQCTESWSTFHLPHFTPCTQVKTMAGALSCKAGRLAAVPFDAIKLADHQE